MSTNPTERVSVIVLAYGEEAHLSSCIDAILCSVDDTGQPLIVEVILVDNGAPDAVARLPADPRLTIVRPSGNLGFAGGCNLGAARSGGSRLTFVNSDAIVEPDAIARLTSALDDPQVGAVSGSVRLADQPARMNTAGNPVHYLGVVWAGSFGELARDHHSSTDIASVTGAFFAVRRAVWEQVAGFDERYFAYHEDADLSLRLWQQRFQVRYEPNAVAIHFYEFSRNRSKQYLLERNRWITVLTVFPRQVVMGTIPVAVIFESLVCSIALVQGWLPDKLRSYGWLIRNRRYLRERRRHVQSVNQMTPVQFSDLLSSRIEPGGLERPPGLSILNLLLSSYWRGLRLLLRDR